MKTSIKHTSETEVLATITIGKQELADAEKVALKNLAKDTKVPGFRKGHAPLEMLAKHVNPNTLAEETLENAVNKAVATAFIDNEVQVLDRPMIEVKKYVPGEELEITAQAPVLPEIKLGDYRKLKVEKPEIKVAADEVNETIERIRKNYADKKETKEAARMGDETVIDFVGKKDGEAFPGGAGTDYPLVLGSGSFIPGFEDGLVGAKKGDKLDIPLTFPKDYHAKDLAGAKVVFETTVKKVNEIVLPEVNDEFAAKLGSFTDVKALKDDIKRELKEQRERDAENDMKDSLVKQLIDKSTVPVPDILLEDQLRSMEQDLTQNLMYQGMTLEQYYESKGFRDRDEWLKKEGNSAAEDRVKAGMVLAELSKVEKVTATADELAERIDSFKTQYASNPEMAKRFDEPEVQRDIANRLLTEKTVDLLVKLNSK